MAKAKKPDVTKEEVADADQDVAAREEYRRTSIMLTKNDIAAIKHIMQKNVQTSRAGAVYFAAEKQAARDRGEEKTPVMYKQLVEDIRPTCKSYLKLAKRNGPIDLTRFLMWRRPRLQENLEAIGQFHKFPHDVESIRFSLRVQAILDGFVLDGEW